MDKDKSDIVQIFENLLLPTFTGKGVIKTILDTCNYVLPDYLKRVKLEQFIPLKRFTIEVIDNYMIVTYYLNRDLYNLMFNDNKGFVLLGKSFLMIDRLLRDHRLKGWDE